MRTRDGHEERTPRSFMTSTPILGRAFEGRAKYVPNRVLLRSVRRTLVGVRVLEAAELLAIDIYTRAEKSGAHLC